MDLIEIYKGLYNDLCHYAYTIIKNDVACHDIVQEVFINIFQKDSLKNIESIKPYLYRAVYNSALNYIRNEQKSSERKTEYLYQNSQLENNEESDIEKIYAKISDVLNELPDTCRTVFLYAKKDNLKYREIAEKMGISIKTVEAHMSLAFKKIKNYLEKNKNKLTILILFFI